jgi:hypothetical protein
MNDYQRAKDKIRLHEDEPRYRDGDSRMYEPSKPLNAASVQFVNSLLQSRISEQSVLRAFDDEEENPDEHEGREQSGDGS